MNHERNIRIARTLLEGMGSGRDPDDVAAPFADDLRFEIQGDVGALPWIGDRIGRQALADFVLGLRTRTEPLSFEVEDVLASDARAVIIGSLRTRIKATDRTAATQFAIVLTVADGIVTRFQMLEDSFDVSRAARYKSRSGTGPPSRRGDRSGAPMRIRRSARPSPR